MVGELPNRGREPWTVDEREDLRALLDASPMPMIALSLPDGRCLYANAAADEARVPHEGLLGPASDTFYAHPDDAVTVLDELSTTGSIRDRQVRLRRTDGSDFWALLSARPVALEGHVAIVAGLADVSAHKATEEALRHAALHDPLTGLANRALFFDALDREMKRARRSTGARFAVLFIDLDGFKEVNDSFGHEIGDALLVGVADRLRRCLRPSDLAARIGGDEFSVLLVDLGEGRQAELVAERIDRELSEPQRVHDYRIVPSASIGIVIGDEAYDTPDDVLRDADRAMYRAKRARKSSRRLSIR